MHKNSDFCGVESRGGAFNAAAVYTEEATVISRENVENVFGNRENMFDEAE
jgi:hypothetical protein